MKKKPIRFLATFGVLTGCVLAGCGTSSAVLNPAGSAQAAKTTGVTTSIVTHNAIAQNSGNQPKPTTNPISLTNLSNRPQSLTPTSTLATNNTLAGTSQGTLQNNIQSIDAQLAKLNADITSANSDINNSGSGN
ncbi:MULTISPECIES: hypothetical protein [Acidithrix]|uniref:Lipoprotein n=1 Tax=Acidithrix ferrooxidans TaxID=1280514 RepID=A0A0D8HDB1_9ACTN|nr:MULTISPECIES: hypothetical protein [Acidithrix]KJF15864.1 hypothetical protein AXFE_32990 [Acidithrix ferrooxidans]CAG4926915.1 unnamed protein product [Acidithrix sp. C25]